MSGAVSFLGVDGERMWDALRSAHSISVFLIYDTTVLIYLPAPSAACLSPFIYFSVKALLNKGLGFCENGMHHLLIFHALRGRKMLTAK